MESKLSPCGIDGDDGDGGLTADLGDDTPAEEGLQASPAGHPHDNQVGVLLPGDSDAFLSRLAGREQRPEAVGRSRCKQGRERPLSFLVQIATSDRHCERWCIETHRCSMMRLHSDAGAPRRQSVCYGCVARGKDRPAPRERRRRFGRVR